MPTLRKTSRSMKLLAVLLAGLVALSMSARLKAQETPAPRAVNPLARTAGNSAAAAEATLHADAAREHAQHAAGSESQPLVPELDDPGTYMQALWVVIIFVVLLAVLYPTAWKNVLAGLKKREDRIRKDIADAETARVAALESLRQYTAQLQTAESQVREILAKAGADAERIAAGVRLHAQQEAEEIKERAMKEIDASRQQALVEIYEQTANLSTSIAEKILRRNLNADDQRELVNESLRKLQAQSN